MKLFISIFIVSLLVVTNLQAEVTLDGTLGPRVALDGPDYAIGADFGQQHGTNLFHSFSQFNLNLDESATFSGPDHIGNVISRVTGGSPSSIDGILRSTIPDADVYLINPAGMMFGSNAELDIPGSFHASTADTLYLQDGGQFNALNPHESVLSVAPVSAFGFLTNSPSSLSFEGSRLIATPGNTLSLIGGPIEANNLFLNSTSGRINIASVASAGEVLPLSEDLTLSAQLGPITLQNSNVNVGSGGSHSGIYIRGGEFFLDNTTVQASTRDLAKGGKIDVQVGELTARHGSRFLSNAMGSQPGGMIKIKVDGLTTFSGYKEISTTGRVNASGIVAGSMKEGNAGSIELETGALHLEDGANISATNMETGQGGHINIHATDSITLSGFGTLGQGSAIAANTRGKMENAGQGGTIVLEAEQLSLTDGAQIGTFTFGAGQGGQINIKAIDNVTLSGKDSRGYTSSISTSSAGSGDGGRISLKAKQLSVTEGTHISADGGGTGQGGHIQIQVSDQVKLEGLDSAGYGSYITAQTVGRTKNAGDGGTIELTAGRLQVSDGAQIGTSSFGPGQGGTVVVKVAKGATFTGHDQSEDSFRSGLFTTSEGETDNAGNGGTIVLIAGDLHLIDQAEINAGTYGPAQGGNVSIQTNTLRLNDGTITALSEAQGNAGQIAIILGDKLVMRNGSSIETKAESADGGNLTITAPNYVYLINSQITTSVSEEFGGGGNITASPEFVVLSGAQIFAKAKKGKGGNIDVTTTGIYNFTEEAIEEIINASSEFGVDGVVIINTPDNTATEGFFALPSAVFDASALMNTPCSERVAENLSRFLLIPSQGTSNAVTDLFASGPLLFKALPVSVKTNTAQQDKRAPTRKAYPLVAALVSGCQPALSQSSDNKTDLQKKSQSVEDNAIVPKQLF